MKQKIFNIIILAVIALFNSCTPFKDEYADKKKRHDFLTPLQGNYTLVSYERNGVSILDSLKEKYKVLNNDFNFEIRWLTDKYESYGSFISAGFYVDSIYSYGIVGSWDAYNMNSRKILLLISVTKYDTINQMSQSYRI